MGYSAERLRALADQIDGYSADAFLTWRNGVSEYPPLFDEWLAAVKDFGAPSPSKVYDRILTGDLAKPTSAEIARADKAHLVGYATFIVRGERFGYGHIGACQKTGLLGAILRRIADLKKRRWFF